MQDPKNMRFQEETPNIKPRKKSAKQKNSSVQLQGADPLGFHPEQGMPSLTPRQKARPAKKNLKKELSPMLQQQPERLNSDSFPDSSSSGNDYRALRRKYLLLEEETCALGNELRVIENEVRSLEDEKFTLLDRLVVLEGLVDPSEMQLLEPRERQL